MNTNINISDNQGHIFKYIIDYNETPIVASHDFKFVQEGDKINIYSDSFPKIKRFGNTWEPETSKIFNNELPKPCKIVEAQLYIPNFSIDVVKNNIYYILSANIWIKNTEINLGTFIIDGLDCLAADRPIRLLNNIYCSSYKINILDPMSILYSDKWKGFREKYCDDEVDLNSSCSIINFTLYPVESRDGIYYKLNDATGGQNSVNVSTESSNYFNLSIKDNLDAGCEEPEIIAKLNFNSFYEQSDKGLKKYLKEVYHINNYSIQYELILGNKDNIYALLSQSSPIFKKIDIINSVKKINKLEFWEEGLKFVASVNITDKDTGNNIYLLSNELLFDLNRLSYFREFNEEKDSIVNKINHIDLDKIDMNVYNINAVNKILNQVVQLENSQDVKNNLIQPVFFKSYPSSDIIIHPEVTENICINLDAYKSRVTTFLIRIGGSTFKEIGRVAAGVLFKIKGKQLSGDTEGTYHILNENEEVVTSGNYKYKN